MRIRVIALACFLACLVMVASALAQDAVSGTWSGDLGTEPGRPQSRHAGIKV